MYNRIFSVSHFPHQLVFGTFPAFGACWSVHFHSFFLFGQVSDSKTAHLILSTAFLGSAIPKFVPEPLLGESRKHQVPQTWVIKPKMSTNGGLSRTNYEQLAGNVFVPLEVHFLSCLSLIVIPLATSITQIFFI
jgi:hypothetical protein